MTVQTCSCYVMQIEAATRAAGATSTNIAGVALSSMTVLKDATHQGINGRQ